MEYYKKKYKQQKIENKQTLRKTDIMYRIKDNLEVRMYDMFKKYNVKKDLMQLPKAVAQPAKLVAWVAIMKL